LIDVKTEHRGAAVNSPHGMEQPLDEGEVTECRRCPVGIASGVAERGRCPFVPRKRAAGAVLHVAGEAVERVSFVKKGAVLITRSVDEERVDGTPWAIRRAGSFLGLEGLVGTQHLDSARALTDITLCSATLETVEAWLDARRPAARVVLDSVLRSGTRERPLRGNADGTAPRRAASWLLENADRRFPGTIPRKVMAGLLGMRPETLSRALRSLAERGAIRHGRASIEILDRARLRSIAFGARGSR
jgi:CRP-like cAMP-binding protein